MKINENLDYFKSLRVPYSSILMIYDVDKVRNNMENLEIKNFNLTIKLIDFGYYENLPKSSETDHDIKFGMNNLIQVLEDIIINKY